MRPLAGMAARLLPLGLILAMLLGVSEASILSRAPFEAPLLGSGKLSDQPHALAELPFGEECTTGPCASNPGVGAGQPRKFMGKERDAETGLDYFGVRYYGSKIGRFTTVDPGMNLQEVNPQKWNKYAYSLNNPLRYVDYDGKWPTAVHNNIIQMASPGLTPAQQHVLHQASYDTDYVITVNGRGPQDPQNSFVHSMSNGVTNQAPREAEQQAQAFIRTQESRAGEQQAAFERSGGEGFSNQALRSVGIGLHTVTDATSPAHAGYQPWHGTGGVGNTAAALAHVTREVRPTPEQLADAVGAAGASFGRAFGETRLCRRLKSDSGRSLS